MPSEALYIFKADTEGTIASPNFKLKVIWEDGAAPVFTQRTAWILKTPKGNLGYSEPLYSAIEIFNKFDTDSELYEHWNALSRFKTMADDAVVQEKS